MVRFLPIVLSCFLTAAAAQQTCNGSISNTQVSKVKIPSNKSCHLNNVVVTDAVEMENGSSLIANGSTFRKEVKCERCKKVDINNAPELGKVEMKECSGATLKLRNSRVSETILVSKGSFPGGIYMSNTCGTEPDDMDVIIEEVNGNVDIGNHNGPCNNEGSGIGDLLIKKVKGNINVGESSSSLRFDSDIEITENTGTIRLWNFNTDEDVKIEKNNGRVYDNSRRMLRASS